MFNFLPLSRLHMAWCFALLLAITSPCHARQSMQAAFSPSPRAIELIVRTIETAQDTIEVAAYSFASPKVSDALIEAHQRGVTVRVVLDKTHATRHYPAVDALGNAGIPIRINKHYAIMHSKYLIIDQTTVETGSFNYTTNAERRNAENVIVLKNNKAIAKQYAQNWQNLWDEAEDYE